MKNVDGLYESNYDTDGELNEAKKKKFDHKQLELVDKTDKESKLDEETKNFLKEIEKREKVLIKRDLLDILTMNLVN